MNQTILLIGILLLALQGRTQAGQAHHKNLTESEDGSDLLILSTNGKDRLLLRKLLSTSDFSILSDEEKIRAISILKALETSLKNQSNPWAM